MRFPISDVVVSPLVPLAVGFVIAFLTTPAGVSGAFLLLPFQVGVLGYVSPGVTPTNLLYNVFSTPGGITSFRLQGELDWPLVKAIAGGAVPGVVAGSLLRVTVFEAPASFKIFVGAVLLLLGANLILQSLLGGRTAPERKSFRAAPVVALAAAAGAVGGIYGISGGSIIAPSLAGVLGLPVRRVAPAALVATFITSITGVASFELIAAFGPAVPSARPDWLLALLLGAGGALGGFTGARFGSRMPARVLRTWLGTLALTLGLFYVTPLL